MENNLLKAKFDYFKSLIINKEYIIQKDNKDDTLFPLNSHDCLS